MTIAIIGAQGAIGRSVIAAYAGDETRLRLVGRNRAPLEPLARPHDDVVAADVSTHAGCLHALAGASAAVYALGLPYTDADFARYPAMMEAFLAAAREQGVKRILLITNVYPYGLPQSATVSEDHPRLPVTRKGEYRKQQEDILLAANGPGLETVSLRLPDFYGPDVETSIVKLAATGAMAGKQGVLLGPATTPHEFVFTPDVGPVVRALLSHAGTISGPYNFAGAGVITQRELAEAFYRAAGRRPRLFVMPPWMQWLTGLFMPLFRDLHGMNYLHRTPVLLDDTKLRRLLPDVRKTPYAEGARLTVGGAAKANSA